MEDAQRLQGGLGSWSAQSRVRGERWGQTGMGQVGGAGQMLQILARREGMN